MQLAQKINSGGQHIFLDAWKDIIVSFSCWRVFYLIGINDIKKRYSRSKLGQFWITLSLAVTIGTLTLVWSILFKLQIATYLPFITIGTIFWTFISGFIIDGANAFINYAHYIKALNIPKASYLNSVLIKNIIIFFHNIVVLIPIFLFLMPKLQIINTMLFIVGFVITSGFLYFTSMFVSVLSLRFRDFPNIIISIMQVVYYLTPIIWDVNLMPQKVQHYLILNPFAVFLSICRDPLLGKAVSVNYWIAAIIYTFLASIVAFLCYSKFRSRIVYWV